MEYSLSTAASLGDIESMVHRFINDSIKRTQSPTGPATTIATASVSAVNQHISDVIQQFIGIANATPSINLLVGAQLHRSGVVVNGTETPPTSTAIVTTPGTPTSLKMEELSHSYDDDVTETKAKGARKIHCSECPRILLSRKNFIKHAEDEHGMTLPIIHKSFDDQRGFDKWMAYLREERQTEFVSKCGRKRLSNGSLLGYLVCSKGGCGGEINSRKKTAKSLKTCAAYLKVLRNELSGKIDVEGCLEHTGHDLAAGPSATYNQHNNNNIKSIAPPSFVVVHREQPASSVDLSQNDTIKYLDQHSTTAVPRESASASSADALDTLGALYGGTLFDSAALSQLPSASSSSSSTYLPAPPASNHTMLPAEILCNFLNAVKQASTQDVNPITNFLPQFFASTPNATEKGQDAQCNFAATSSYNHHNAPTPPGGSTFGQLPASVKLDEDDMIATSSSDQVVTAPATPESSRPSQDVSNEQVERRKLALIERFQIVVQKIDKSTIDGAEVAMRFFIRELEGLSSKNSSI